jgi:hypothetical protein
MSDKFDLIDAVNSISLNGFQSAFKKYIQTQQDNKSDFDKINNLEAQVSNVISNFRGVKDSLNINKDYLEYNKQESDLLQSELKSLNNSISRFMYDVTLKTSYSVDGSADVSLSAVIVYLNNIFSYLSTMILKSKVNRIEGELKEVQRLSAGVAVAEYAKIYSDDKDRNETLSEIWLFVSYAALSITLIFAFYHFENFADDVRDNAHIYTSNSALVLYALIKIFLTGLFVSITLWAAKMYKIERNLWFINRQKENALNTFKAFHNAAGENPAIREAILMEATKSIFSANNTGLIQNENSSDESMKIIEIVKNVTSSKGK